MNEFIDCQVDFGKSAFGPNCDIKVFDYHARRLGITRAIVIPTMTHDMNFDSYREQSCIWEETTNGLVFRRIIMYLDGAEEREINPENPYALMNRLVLSTIREINTCSSVKYYFVPKVHPFLDTAEEITSIITEPETVAVKINGLASHSVPNDVSQELVTIVNKHNKAFFVHTDYLNADSEENLAPTYLHELIEGNAPQAWLDWAELRGVQRLFLAHLARMDPEAIRRVNSSEKYLIGLGPDLMLQNEPQRLCQPTNNILADALQLIDSDKLAFSSDFAWNVSNRENWGEHDWEVKNRLVAESLSLNLHSSHLEKVLGENAIRFFRLD